MELRHLRYFVTLASKRHFTQAAEELAIAQPALSQQIQALERELGVRLFERTSRSMRLTLAGETLLTLAERVLADAEHIQIEMQAFAKLKRGRLRIGLLQSIGTYWLAGLLARFHTQYPGVEIVLHEGVTDILLEQLESGTLDMVWMHTIKEIFPAKFPDKHIETLSVFTEPLLLGVAPQHHLTQQKIHVSDLKEEEFILFKPGSGLRQTVLHMTERAGFVPHVIFESGDIGSIRALVAEGVGISVFPQSVIDGSETTIVPLEVQPTLPQRTILLAWQQRRASSPGIQEFLTFLRQDITAHPWTQVIDEKR